MKTKWVICYDISDDKSRRKVFETLKDYGSRTQYSVFESSLTQKQQQALKLQLSEHLEAGDSIRWYPLCRWCDEKTTLQGTATTAGNTDYFIV